MRGDILAVLGGLVNLACGGKTGQKSFSTDCSVDMMNNVKIGFAPMVVVFYCLRHHH